MDTKYYLYILKFLQMEAGDYTARAQVARLMDECNRFARDLSRPSSSFEWLGTGNGFERCSTLRLGTMGFKRGLFPEPQWLERVDGRIATIRHPGSGEIELSSGLRAFFTLPEVLYPAVTSPVKTLADEWSFPRVQLRRPEGLGCWRF